MLTRRGFLAAAALLPACAGDPWADDDLADDARFPDGVIAGPHPGGAILVIQVDDLVGARRIGLEVSGDVDLDHILLRRIVEVPALAPGVPLIVELEDDRFEPGNELTYRWVTRGTASPIGRFRVPRHGADDRPIRLGFFSCQGYPAGYFTAHRGLAAEPDLDLVVCLGDYIYDWTDDVGPDDRVDTIGAAYPGLAESLDEYRAKYKLYRSDPDLQAMQARHTVTAVWDNHELAAELPQLEPRLPLAERVANGKAAFWEQMPLVEGPAARPLFRKLRLGALVELFLLDLHSYAAPPGSGGSYLGEAQLGWLLDGLESSTARWKLIATSTVMMGLDLSEGMTLNTNQWDGFPEERRTIVEHVRLRRIGGVIALSGDLHTMLVGPVTTTGRADGIVGFPEISVGAISSEGILALRPGDEDTARGIEEYTLEQNAHLAFIDILTRGYAVLDASRDELWITLRGVGTVYAQSTGMRDVRRIRVRWPGPTVELVS